MTKIVDTNQLCKIYGVSRQTISRWREDEGLPFFKDGYHVRFDLDEVNKWIKETKDVLTQEELSKAMEIISYRSSMIRQFISFLKAINKDNLDKEDIENYKKRELRYNSLIKKYEDYRDKWFSGQLTKADFKDLIALEKSWKTTDVELSISWNKLSADKAKQGRYERKLNRAYDEIKDTIERNKFFKKIEGDNFIKQDKIYLDIEESKFNDLVTSNKDIDKVLEELNNQDIQLMFIAEKNETGAYLLKDNAYIPGIDNRFKGDLKQLRRTSERNDIWKAEKKRRKDNGS